MDWVAWVGVSADKPEADMIGRNFVPVEASLHCGRPEIGPGRSSRSQIYASHGGPVPDRRTPVRGPAPDPAMLKVQSGVLLVLVSKYTLWIELSLPLTEIPALYNQLFWFGIEFQRSNHRRPQTTHHGGLLTQLAAVVYSLGYIRGYEIVVHGRSVKVGYRDMNLLLESDVARDLIFHHLDTYRRRWDKAKIRMTKCCTLFTTYIPGHLEKNLQQLRDNKTAKC